MHVGRVWVQDGALPGTVHHGHSGLCLCRHSQGEKETVDMVDMYRCVAADTQASPAALGLTYKYVTASLVEIVGFLFLCDGSQVPATPMNSQFRSIEL